MPIYYGHPATQSRQKRIEVSPNLKEQGIELLRAIPSQVHAFTIPFVENPLWSSFIVSLSAILFSIANRIPVSLNLGGYRIDARHPSPLPIRYPDLCVKVLNLNPAVHQWLIDTGFEEQEIRGTTYFLFLNPNSADLETITSESCPAKFDEENYVPLRFANLSALYVFSEITNIFSFLLQALSAPLWAHNVTRGDLIKTFDNTTETDDDLMTVDNSGTVAGTSTKTSKAAKGHTLTKLFTDPSALVMTPTDKLGVDATKLSQAYAWSSLTLMTDADELGYGNVARYIPDLSDDDPHGVTSFILKYLKRSLGNDTMEILETVDRYKSAWGILKSTSSGHILSHIVKSVEIAIEAHCAVTAIFDNDYYEGALIQGLGYVISLRSGDHLPLDSPELKLELSAMETHRKATTEIRKALEVALGEEGSEDIPDDFEDMDALRKLLLKGTFNEEERLQIKKTAQKLRFPIRKWSINLGTILKMLDVVAGGVDAIDRDFPIGPEGLFSNDPVEIVMSCFNRNGCPSFRHPSGVPVNLRASKAPTPPTELRRKGGRGPQQINNGGWIFSIRRVEFSEAVNDFRVMMREGEARSMSSAAARGLGYFVVSGGNFEKVFAKAKECLAKFSPGGLEKQTESESSTRMQKRVLSGDNPGGAAPKRPKKFMI